MKNLTKVLMGTVAIALFSCNGPSLENYYVDNQEQDGFIVLNVPTSALISDTSQFSAEEKQTFQSIEKANILVFPAKKENKEILKKKQDELEKILKDEDYKLLMKFGSADQQFKLMYEGDPESIDEMIVYGSSDEMGFGVARILGNNMNPGAIMKLAKSLDSTNINLDGMKNLKEIIHSKVEKDSLSIGD